MWTIQATVFFNLFDSTLKFQFPNGSDPMSIGEFIKVLGQLLDDFYLSPSFYCFLSKGVLGLTCTQVIKVYWALGFDCKWLWG